MKKLSAVLVGLGLALTAGSALADVEIEDKGTGDVTYKFGDDKLLADGLDANIAQIKVRNHTVRRTLIRPRVSFVHELLKSVDNL